MTHHKTQRQPWEGAMRERIADTAAWLRQIATRYEQGDEDLPDQVRLDSGTVATEPGKSARVMARRILVGDCRASRAEFSHIRSFHESIHQHLED